MFLTKNVSFLIIENGKKGDNVLSFQGKTIYFLFSMKWCMIPVRLTEIELK